MFELYTDGACIGNPGPGGWAFLLKNTEKGTEHSASGGEPDTTNNRMELFAVIAGFEDINQKQKKAPTAVTVYSDSKYVVDAFRQKWLENWQRRGWKTADKKPVKNKDLWERLLEAVDGNRVTWEWVKGHSGHVENEVVDQLAQQAALAHSGR